MPRRFLADHLPLLVVLVIFGLSAALAPNSSNLSEIVRIAARSLYWTVRDGGSGGLGPDPGIYLVLQLAALAIAPRWWRVLVALPLPIMVPIWCETEPNSTSNVWPIVLIIASKFAWWLLGPALAVALYVRLRT